MRSPSDDRPAATPRDDFDPGARLCGHAPRHQRQHYLGGGLGVCFECLAKTLGVSIPMTIVDRTAAIARDVRTGLLRLRETPRDLAGQCGLVAMIVALAIERPAALRTGFYMKHETLWGRRGRSPHRHAWCRVAATIVDPTATQFGARHRAVHVAIAAEDDRYIETASGADAIDDIMTNWCGRELPAYVALAKRLRRRLACRS